MPWGNLTVSDVEAHLNAGELDEYRQHAAHLDDPLPTIIADCVALVRGHIPTRYRTSEHGIPDELRIPAIDIVIHRLAKRVRKSTDDDADRRGAAERAIRMLESVAKGEFAGLASGADGSGCWGSESRFDPR